MDLVVDGVYCGACIVTIEKGLKRERGVRGARVNLASKRVTVEWDDGAAAPSEILENSISSAIPPIPSLRRWSTASKRRKRNACCAASASQRSAR